MVLGIEAEGGIKHGLSVPEVKGKDSADVEGH